MRTRGLALALCSFVGALGCGTSAPAPRASGAPAASASAAAPTAPTWTSCDDGVGASGDPARDLERLGRSCGRALAMRPLGAPREATQSAGAAVDRYAFALASAGACFRVHLAAEPAIGEIDLAVRAPDGKLVTSVERRAGHAIAPPEAPACVDAPGVYSLEVGVERGAGRYALQVFVK